VSSSDEILPAAIAMALGAVADAELMTDRRGSRIWRVQLDNGQTLAVKAAYDNPEDTGVQDGARLLAAREANALAAMGDLAGDYLHAHGEVDAATWLAVRWLNAPTLQRRWKAARKEDNPAARYEALTAAVSAAAEVARLHAAGWRHADLQPAHIICPDGVAQLIDFALAQGPNDEPRTPHVNYRGGLVHLDAPELAQALLDNPAHITLTVEAEVFSLAAVLVTCWTGLWMYDYGAPPWEAPMEHILGTIASGRRSRLADQRPWAWPKLETLLAAALDLQPSGRPTAAEFFAGLSDLRQ